MWRRSVVELFWLLPEPEAPDENGEIGYPMPHPDGGMTCGYLHVATGVWRPMTIDDLLREVEKGNDIG